MTCANSWERSRGISWFRTASLQRSCWWSPSLTGEEQGEREMYRVITLGRRGADVLLVPNGERYMLPWVEIPRRQRVAQNLTAMVKSDWGEKVICLFEPSTKPPVEGDISYQVLEHLCACGHPKMPTRWVPLSTLCDHAFTDEQDYAVIKQSVLMSNKEIEGASTRPFVRLGWFRELRNWIESVVEPMRLHLTGEFQQLNASASFSLIRFETNGPALWFKAVGEPNQRELAVTCALARFFPDHLPMILGSRPDWNGWLAREVEGKLLSEVEDRGIWERVAGALARLQIECVDRSSQILEAGARDLGLAALSKLIQPFMTVVEQLMDQQTKSPPAVLGRKDLLGLADSLQMALDATEAASVPRTLGHLDLNPGNIIVSKNRTTFIDWAEAYVGNPFWSLEYLFQHANRVFGADSEIENRLTQAYCAQWAAVVPPTAMAEALAFAPFLAVFAYAAGTGAWQQPEQLQQSATAGYLRSLTRRMHREAQQLIDRRLLCPQ